MQVPIRKGGKFTGLKADPQITEEKYQELKANLNKLVKYKRPQAIEEVTRLALMGDFSENAAYQIAKGRLRGINQRILEIEDHLKRAIIIKPQAGLGLVQVGSRVIVEANGREKEFLILGSAETDPAAGVISRNSPIGLALLGHREGEIVPVKLADRAVNYKIVKVNV